MSKRASNAGKCTLVVKQDLTGCYYRVAEHLPRYTRAAADLTGFPKPVRSGLEVLYDDRRDTTAAGRRLEAVRSSHSVYGAYPWARYHSIALRSGSRAGVCGRLSSRTALLESKYSHLRERRTLSGVAAGVWRGFNRARATST